MRRTSHSRSYCPGGTAMVVTTVGTSNIIAARVATDMQVVRR